MNRNDTYHYPGNDSYTDNLYKNEVLSNLSGDSKIIRLLEELESRGNDIAGARDEVNALLNYVSHNEKLKKDAVTHLEYLLEKMVTRANLFTLVTISRF